MLTLADCIAFSDLSDDEIRAIAEHEHLPDIIACELGSYLVHCPDGTSCIRRIILADLQDALDRGDVRQAAKLRLVLRHFVDAHRDGGQRARRPSRGRPLKVGALKVD